MYRIGKSCFIAQKKAFYICVRGLKCYGHPAGVKHGDVRTGRLAIADYPLIRPRHISKNCYRKINETYHSGIFYIAGKAPAYFWSTSPS